MRSMEATLVIGGTPETLGVDTLTTAFEEADTTLAVEDWWHSKRYLIIPTTVERVDDEVFRVIDQLVEIVFPDSVETIDRFACAHMAQLERVIIGNGVRVIEERVFYSCGALTHVELGRSVQTLGKSAFRNCTALESVHFPNSVTEIHEDAFRTCEKLQLVIINDRCRLIGQAAFEGCTAMVQIPQCVMSVGRYAFTYTNHHGLMPRVLLVKPASVRIEGWEQVWIDAYAEGKAWLGENIVLWAPDEVVALLGGPFAACKTMADVPKKHKYLPGVLLPSWERVMKFKYAPTPDVLTMYRSMEAQVQRGPDGLAEVLPLLPHGVPEHISQFMGPNTLANLRQPEKPTWIDGV